MVYTGIVRMPQMAIAAKVPFAGEWVDLMAQYYTTTADIYRIFGELPVGTGLLATADNGEKSIDGFEWPLVRMLELDTDANNRDRWKRFIEYLAEQQLHLIQYRCERLLAKPLLSSNAPLVRAGLRRFLIKRIGRRLSHPHVGIESLFASGESIAFKEAECAPAVAMASLALEGSK